MVVVVVVGVVAIAVVIAIAVAAVVVFEAYHHGSYITENWVVWEAWWRHTTKTFSALLAICAANSSDTGSEAAGGGAQRLMPTNNLATIEYFHLPSYFWIINEIWISYELNDNGIGIKHRPSVFPPRIHYFGDIFRLVTLVNASFRLAIPLPSTFVHPDKCTQPAICAFKSPWGGRLNTTTTKTHPHPHSHPRTKWPPFR